MENLVGSWWWKNFGLDLFVLSTYDSFRDTIRNSSDRNVVTAYFAGHCGEDGSLCFNKDNAGVEMEMLGPEYVVRLIAGARRGAGPAGGTIEATVLNTCYSRVLGLALRERGVMHVVCWHGKVLDAIAAKFAEEFFKELTRRPTEYKEAFEAGRLEVKRLDASAADHLCFLSDVGQVDVSPHLLEACPNADIDKVQTWLVELGEAESVRVKFAQREIDVEGSDVDHVVGLEQQPGHGAADNGELAFIAAEDLADLYEGLADCGGATRGIVRRALRFRLHHCDTLASR